MNRTEYEATPGVNFSTLKAILRSPAHYQAALIAKREPTPAMVMGTITHSTVLEGKSLETLAVAKPEGMSFVTKDGKAWRDEQTLPIMSTDDYNAVTGMAASVAAHPEASTMLAECPNRETFLTAEFEGVVIKGLIDAHGATILADLKTTSDASPSEFMRKVQALHYDFQIAFYQQLVSPEIWCGWITVENEYPHVTAVYTPSAALLESGREKMRRAIALYKECQKANAWPAFPGITTLHLPKWREMELQ